MYRITFKFLEKGLEAVVIDNAKPGYSILDTALMNDIDLHHNCGGVCSCTTCHVYIDKGMEYIEEKSKREIDFLERAEDPKANSRLGCQSILLEGDGEMEILLPDQSKIGDDF